MKQLILTLLLAGANLAFCHAQIPKYIKSNYTGTPPYASLSFHGNDQKIQSIYYPTDFAGMPKGTVSNIYLRVGFKYNTPNSITYHNVTVKIGYTADSSFPNYGSWDTFKVNLTTMYNAASRVFIGADTIGTWMKFPCTAGNFAWNGTQKFVVEVSHGPEGGNINNGFDWLASINTAPKRRGLGGYKDSIRVNNSSYVTILDLGLDITTTGAGGLSNVSSFGLFPNPSTDGRFNISLDAKQAVNEVVVTVTNTTGQQVLRRQYAGTGSSFFRELDMGGVAKGVYFVVVTADGERLMRRVVIE